MTKKSPKKAVNPSDQTQASDPIDDALRLAKDDADVARRRAKEATEARENTKRREVDFPRLLDAAAAPLAGNVKTPWIDWDCTKAGSLGDSDPAYVDEILPLWIAVGRAVRELGIVDEFLRGIEAASDKWQKLEPGKNYPSMAHVDREEFDSVSYKAAGLIGAELWKGVVSGPWNGDGLTPSALARLRPQLVRVQAEDVQVFMRISHLPTVWACSVGAERGRAPVETVVSVGPLPLPDTVIAAALMLLRVPPAKGLAGKELAKALRVDINYIAHDVVGSLTAWGMKNRTGVGYYIPADRRPALRRHLGMPQEP